jgi:hypothetical protein
MPAYIQKVCVVDWIVVILARTTKSADAHSHMSVVFQCWTHSAWIPRSCSTNVPRLCELRMLAPSCWQNYCSCNLKTSRCDHLRTCECVDVNAFGCVHAKHGCTSNLLCIITRMPYWVSVCFTCGSCYTYSSGIIIWTRWKYKMSLHHVNFTKLYRTSILYVIVLKVLTFSMGQAYVYIVPREVKFEWHRYCAIGHTKL